MSSVENPSGKRSLVIEAAKTGDIERLMQIGKTRANVNVVDTEREFTPLLWACQAGHVKHGADVSYQTSTGWTVCHVAAITGQDQCMEVLIEHGVDLTVRDSRGCTAAHLAAAHGHAGTLHTILRYGLDVDIMDKSEWMPIHHAAFHGRLNCMQTLVKWGARTHKEDLHGNTPTKTARDLALRFHKMATMEVIDKALKELANCGNDLVELRALRCPAHKAAYQGDLDTLQRLVEQGVASINERDEDGSTPMHKSAGQGHLHCLEWLLEMGGDRRLRNIAGESPQDVAKRFAQLAAVKMLQAGKADTDTEEKVKAEGPLEETDTSCISMQEQNKAEDQNIESIQDLKDLRGGEEHFRSATNPLEEQLQAERIRREKLESQIDTCRTEIRQLRQVLRLRGDDGKLPLHKP